MVNNSIRGNELSTTNVLSHLFKEVSDMREAEEVEKAAEDHGKAKNEMIRHQMQVYKTSAFTLRTHSRFSFGRNRGGRERIPAPVQWHHRGS